MIFCKVHTYFIFRPAVSNRGAEWQQEGKSINKSAVLTYLQAGRGMHFCMGDEFGNWQYKVQDQSGRLVFIICINKYVWEIPSLLFYGLRVTGMFVFRWGAALVLKIINYIFRSLSRCSINTWEDFRLHSFFKTFVLLISVD